MARKWHTNLPTHEFEDQCINQHFKKVGKTKVEYCKVSPTNRCLEVVAKVFIIIVIGRRVDLAEVM